MPTVELPDEPMLRHPVVFQTQPLDILNHRDAVAVPPGSTCVYPEGDLEWLTPSRIAPFEAFTDRGTRFASVGPSPGNAGCLVLGMETRIMPRYPLTDDRCPVITLGQELRRLGWEEKEQLVVHTDVEPSAFDSRGGVSSRWCRRVLITALVRGLSLSSNRIPSNQPMAYYRCLLDGLAVEPGMGNQHYLQICNANRKRVRAPLVPVEDGDDDPPVLEDGDDEMVLADDDAPASPKKLSRGGRGRGGRGGRGDGRGRGRGGVPVGPPPLPPGVDVPPIVERPPSPIAIPPPNADSDEELLADREDDIPGPRRGLDRPPLDFKDGLDGARIAYDNYVHPKSGKEYKNYIISCDGRGHGNCYKTRGALPAAIRRHGDLEPLAFLHSWRPCVWPSRPGVPTHRRENPSQAEVGAYFAAREAELRVVYARIHG